MQFTPTLEEARAYAAEGRYRVLPVACEILSDALTPIEVLRILKHVSAHTYLLESAAQNGFAIDIRNFHLRQLVESSQIVNLELYQHIQV